MIKRYLYRGIQKLQKISFPCNVSGNEKGDSINRTLWRNKGGIPC
jgi:hypothetical protein